MPHAVLAGFMGLTLPLMPVQALLVRISQPAARRFPHWYHRKVCRILGIRLHIEGDVPPGPVLLVSNHTSWLDIPVLSAVAPVSFVAKSEVSRCRSYPPLPACNAPFSWTEPSGSPWATPPTKWRAASRSR